MLNVKIKKVKLKDIQFDDLNAQVLSDHEFAILVKTIKDDGDLLTTPLVRQHDGELYCVDGEHRIRAALEAGIKEADVKLVTDMDLEEGRKRMLALNNLSGEADEKSLAKLLLAMEEGNEDILDELSEMAGFDINFLDQIMGDLEQSLLGDDEIQVSDEEIEETIADLEEDEEEEDTNDNDILNDLPPERSDVGMDETGNAPNAMQEDDMDSFTDFNISISSSQSDIVMKAFAEVMAGFEGRVKNATGVALVQLCAHYLESIDTNGHGNKVIFSRYVETEDYEVITSYLTEERDVRNISNDGRILADLIRHEEVA